MTEKDSDDGNVEIDKLLAELENDTVPEESDYSKLNPKAENTPKKLKRELNYEDTPDDKTERNEENTW